MTAPRDRAARGIRAPGMGDDDRPARPVLVELAAAILVIGSGIDTVISLEGLMSVAGPEERLLGGLSVAAGCGLVALGILIRGGRAWLLTLNVVAIAAFLELRSVTFGGILAAVLDMLVVGILLRERWWFRWVPRRDGDPLSDDA